MTNVIEVKNFAMKFGDKTVVKNLSFAVKRGETFGLLGSNGSGKTTTIRALLGIYDATAGEILVDGAKFDVARGAKIGYLPEERGLYKKESALDVMIYFGQLKGMTRSAAKKFSEKYLARVGLSDKANSRIDKLSGGQQQKVQLGITIMNDPEILILDEPTKGFDPVNRRILLDIIFECQERGATILMISHQMDDVEKICDCALLLKDGVAREYGTIAEIREKYGGAHMEEIFLKIYGAEKDEDGEFLEKRPPNLAKRRDKKQNWREKIRNNSEESEEK